jgi:hypothetical protein
VDDANAGSFALGSCKVRRGLDGSAPTVATIGVYGPMLALNAACLHFLDRPIRLTRQESSK